MATPACLAQRDSRRASESQQRSPLSSDCGDSLGVVGSLAVPLDNCGEGHAVSRRPQQALPRPPTHHKLPETGSNAGEDGSGIGRAC